MEKKRDIYIDVLKALAIFLVVLGHAPLCDSFVKSFIYSFHMPLFFAIYGFTYSIESHQRRGFLNKAFIASKIKRLVIPAVVWSFGYTIITEIFNDGVNIKHLLLDLYGSQAAYRAANSLTSIWFLPVMFLSVCVVEWMMSLLGSVKRDKKKVIVLLVFVVFLPTATIIFPKLGIGYPGGANIVPTAMSFILIGIIIKELNVMARIKEMRWIIAIILSMVLATITAVLTYYNLPNIKIHNVDMASATFGNPLLYMFTAILGIIMMLFVARLFVKLPGTTWWTFVGSNTLGIFLLHKPIVIALCNLSTKAGLTSWPISIVYSLLAIIISCPILFFIDRTLPQIIGNNRKLIKK